MTPSLSAILLSSISDIIKKMADPDIFTWLPEKRNPDEMEIMRSSTIVADRLCGAVADPIIRNAQEKRQLAAITTLLESKGYSLAKNGVHYDEMLPGSFSFHTNVPVYVAGEQGEKVNIPVDVAIMPLSAQSGNMPLLLEAKSAGDFTNVNATGIEIDPVYYGCATKVWKESKINLINDDFTQITPQQKYNLVITNPPYVRHHYLTQTEKSYLLEREKKETKISLSGLAGLYCHFILLAHKWLAPGAICGWLIPSEFMDVNYGIALKEYLLQNVHLLRIHRYDPENSMFSDALVSSCVVWFKNEKVNEDYDIEFSFGGTHDKPIQSKRIKKSCLEKERKWTRFPGKEIRCEKSAGITLGDYFEIKRGLATGDNNFFIMNQQKIMELGLDMSFFKPILPSPRYLKTDLVDTDTDGIPKLEQPYFLLDCELTEQEIMKLSPSTWNYLQSGIDKTSKKYLCKSRKRWYWQEQRESTYFLCSYMGRGKNNSSPIRFM